MWYYIIVEDLNCQSEVRIFEGVYPLKSLIKPLIWLFVVKRVYIYPNFTLSFKLIVEKN